MSESTGQYAILEGFCGRVEAQQGFTVFLRIDEKSLPGSVDEAHEHFKRRHEADEAFPGQGLWAGTLPVRVTALRWDAEHRVLRLKVERPNEPQGE